MSTQTAFVSTETFTQKEFKHWLDERPASDINQYELLRGRIVMSPPAGWPYGSVEANIHIPLGSFVRTHEFGITLGSSARKRFGRGKVYTGQETLLSRTLKGFMLRLNEVFV